MDMKENEKNKKHKKKSDPRHKERHEKKESKGKKSNVTKSLCRNERDLNINDISNMRCHGLEMGNDKE